MKIRHKESQDVEIDMSPMIDMVFLLLIFFIVASQIVKIDKVKVDIPSAVYAVVPEDETGRFMITVDKEGEVFAGLAQEKVTLDELRDKIAEAVDADDELRILIRADGQTKYEESEKIMEVCADVGANDMIFAAFEQ